MQDFGLPETLPAIGIALNFSYNRCRDFSTVAPRACAMSSRDPCCRQRIIHKREVAPETTSDCRPNPSVRGRRRQ